VPVSSADPANYIALGKPPARDTPATTYYFLRHLDGSGIEIDPEIQREREGGDNQIVSLSYRSQVKADPQLGANSRPQWAGNALPAILGADAIQAVVATSPSLLMAHTIVAVGTVPYYTVHERAADEVTQVTNCKAQQLEAEWEAGRPLKLTLQMVGGGTYMSVPAASALTPVRETVKPHFYPGASVVVGGVPNARVTKGKITFSRELDADIQTTGLNRADVLELNQDYQLDATLVYEDATLWRRAHYGGGSQALADLATCSIDIYFPGPASQGVRLNIPLMEITGVKINKLDPDGKTVYYDLAAAVVAGATGAVALAQVWSTATAPY